MNWTQLLQSEIDGAYGATDGLLALAEGLPLDWKPAGENNWMTTGQLIRHIASACGGPSKGFVTGEWGMPAPDPAAKDKPAQPMFPPASTYKPYDSIAEARAKLAEDKKTALAMIAQAGEERLANDPAPAPWDPRPIPLGQRLLSMVKHLESHKCQLYYYLKLQGKPVNTMNLWGAS